MDLSTLITRCETRFQDPNNRTFSEANWTSYLNDVYDEVNTASEYWPWLESRVTDSLTLGNNEITLPTNVYRVSAVYNETDGYLVDQIDGRDVYREAFPDLNPRGRPTVYRLRSNIVEFYPVPDGTISIILDIFVHPALLALGTDEPVFPRAYHRYLVDGAVSYAHQDDGAMEQAAGHQRRFEDGLARMKQELLGPRTARYPVVLDLY